MPKLSAAQVRAYATGAGFTDAQAPVVVAIAYQESGFDTAAVGDQKLADDKWGPSIGLMQIRSLRNPSAYSGADAMRVASQLTDPAYNMRVAYAIFKEAGGKFTDWSTYNNRNKPGSGWAQAIGQGFGSNDPTTGAGAAVTDAVNGAYDAVTDNPVTNSLSGLDAIGSLASKLQDGEWWKRVGIGVTGYALLLVGILFILVSSTQVKDAAKTAGGAAVGLLPGGGAVTSVAKGVAKTAAKGAAK